MKRAIASSAWGRGLVLATVLLAGTLGFCCLFDGDHHGQESSPDLCLTLLSTLAAPVLLTTLLRQGWATDAIALPVRSASLAVLTPPPRSL
jgi:hypothetical protein